MENNDKYHNPQGGKGSKRRPTDGKAFAENYEQVFGKKPAWYEKPDRFKKTEENNK